jgi:hypothetical protein
MTEQNLGTILSPCQTCDCDCDLLLLDASLSFGDIVAFSYLLLETLLLFSEEVHCTPQFNG